MRGCKTVLIMRVSALCLMMNLLATVGFSAGNTERCVASIGGFCPPTWSPWGDKCYKVTKSQTLAWQEAKEACLALGGAMVVPCSDEETMFLETLQSQTWIGCNDLQTEGTWVCREGATYVAYRNWDKREPNNVKGLEHCAVIKKCGRWTDVPCDEQYPAVCTRPTQHKLHM
ncbi:mannose-binding protein C-like [Acanthaster planci]|uniref:Mannose-binding protein C-like n=1 Tax=Acanthaster planci TaxID=133434 RepID=A0A8B7Y8X5_ACAPL|nr:mannose-binding protein C-like [Acanthaster planci]